MPPEGAAKEPPLVLLDTNALMMPFQLGLDIEGEVARLLGRCRIAVPACVMRELRGLASRDPDARAALQLAVRFSHVPCKGAGDDAILELAMRERAYVVTGDRGLMARLRAANVRVLRPRERHRLELW